MPSKSTKKFRDDLRALKKAGIVDVDVNRAQPYWVRKAGPRGGTYTLTELIKKYDDILSKKATPVMLPPEEKKSFTKLGYETTKSGAVIIPHARTEKVTVRKGKVVKKHLAGIERVQEPVRINDLQDYLSKAKDFKKDSGKQFAFHFYGGHSMTYSSIDLLLSDLEHYKKVEEAIGSGSVREMNEVYRNLEIVQTTKAAWKTSKRKTAEMVKASKKTPRKPRKSQLQRLKEGPKWKLEEYRKKRAAAERKRRKK